GARTNRVCALGGGPPRSARGCGTINGKARYCPEETATRARMLVILGRASGIPRSGHPDAFDDDDGHFGERALNAAAAFDIKSGCGCAAGAPDPAPAPAWSRTFRARPDREKGRARGKGRGTAVGVLTPRDWRRSAARLPPAIMPSRFASLAVVPALFLFACAA